MNLTYQRIHHCPACCSILIFDDSVTIKTHGNCPVCKKNVTYNITEPKQIKKWCLEWLSSEIVENRHEEGESNYTGCGIGIERISHVFDTKQEMLDWIEKHYDFKDFDNDECMNESLMETSKMVADHSSEQNGGWFEPTEAEIKAWKEGKIMLYSERCTIKYHTIYMKNEL